MIVMKFGGTSVGSADRFIDVARIVETTIETDGPPVVVLSAMSGITNLLIEGAGKAKEHDLDTALEIMAEIRQKHKDVIYTLFQESKLVDELTGKVEEHFRKLDILYRGVSYLGELTKRSLDTICSMGELLSTQIFQQLLETRGTKSAWLDARTFLITDNKFAKANPLWETTAVKAKGAILPEIAAGRVVVTQGFIGATSNGITTTLGRGGSDYSASIIGVSCEAVEIQIWTDVDGMMTADPRIVPEASVLPQVSFHEASELAYFGAKVLHPLTIRPAVEKEIPVRILNTMRPELNGTVITKDGDSQGNVCAIASKSGITALFITSLNMLMAHGYLARVFALFDKFKTPIDLISTSEVSVSVTIDDLENLDSLLEALQELADVRVVSDLSIVSVVGKQFRNKHGIAGEIFECLKDINILVISGGASDINLSFVVAKDDAAETVKQLHQKFFSSASEQIESIDSKDKSTHPI